MKFGAAILVLATSALASNVRRGDEYESPDYSGGEYEAPEGDYGSGDYGYKHDNGYKHEVTQVEVTYTTTTVCPVTYTHHEQG
jgi:hypothetical protein